MDEKSLLRHSDEESSLRASSEQSSTPFLPQDESIQPARRRTRLSLWTLINVVVFLASVVCLITSWFISRPRLLTCLEETSEWSPVLKELPPLETRRYEGSFDLKTPFKGPPNAEVDATWHNITNIAAMSISEEDFQKLNSSKHAAVVPDELGGGRLALLEFVHQIHCLNKLWRHTYQDYYTRDYNYSINHPDKWHAHIDHCTDILRQHLMCKADAGVITYNWQKNHYAPHPNFNVEHKCRNFDVMWQYAMDHRVDTSNYPQDHFERPLNGDWVEFDEPPFDPDADE